MNSPPTGSRPLISVIVPAFNAEATLRETLNSALASTYREVEILIVDDGSTDGTAAIAEEFARCDDRVRLRRQENGGVSAAFNAGLALARGDYVARLDADDLWHPQKLEKQVELLHSQSDAAFIYTFVRYIDDEGRVVSDVEPQRFPPTAFCRGIYESIVGANSSALMRRSAVADAGGYVESLTSWEDLLLQLQLSARYPVAFVPEYLVGYRIRRGSLSSDPENMMRSWSVVRRLIDRHFPQAPEFVHHWSHSKRSLEFAEGFAWRGRFGASALQLAEALRHDPERTSLYLAYRTARRAGKYFNRPEDKAAGPRFLECEPKEQVRPTPAEDGRLLGLLRRLEARRTARLDRLDEQLARRTATNGRSSGAA